MHIMSRSAVAKLLCGALVAAAAAFASGCGSGNSGSTQASQSAHSGKELKIGLALAGPRNDGSFYQEIYDGMKQAAAASHGAIKLSVVDNLEDPQHMVSALRGLAQGNALVVAGGGALASPAENVAPAFPNATFVELAGTTNPSISNLHSYVLNMEAPAYVLGRVGALVTKAHKATFLAGLQVTDTRNANPGFKAGFTSKDAPGGASNSYSTVIVGSFSDVVKGKNAASAAVANGSDIIMGFMDAGDDGVVQALKNAKTPSYMFDALANRCSDYKGFVGLITQNAARLIKLMLADYKAGKLPKGTKSYGVEDTKLQGVQLCPAFSKYQRQVKTIIGQLGDGQIQLPPTS